MTEIYVRYLEMIQDIITRMATNSFMIKGWAITILAAIFVLSEIQVDFLFVLVALFPLRIRVSFNDSVSVYIPILFFKIPIYPTRKKITHKNFQENSILRYKLILFSQAYRLLPDNRCPLS